ncbi:MAG: NAD(P)H-dependent oxidoreductase subunit E [Verrucomicrobiales bacterium]|nr:NAD(P)H-dependent oxidoreductase subunit E [Verrucomicrobiales bacterium]
MPKISDQQLIALWRDEPAPLLPVLHAFHDRDGFLSEEALRAVADGLKIPIADLYGTVTFYHHFSLKPAGLAPRVCTGNVCCLRGGKELLETLKAEGATAMPCAGRCDDPVPVLRGNEVLIGTSPENLRAKPSPLPGPNPGGCEECIFAHIREPGRATLDGYRRTNGYEALTKAVRELTPAQLLGVITESKLAGRGGAGFSTGAKWTAVSEAPGKPKSIVCNADEGEPGCFKDRAIMDYDPHAVLEGMALAGYATGAARGFIYLRYEYPETFRILERAIAEAEEVGLLGADVLGSGFAFKTYLRRGAGAYICGEEGSLLNSLEGKHPFPRNKPPFPVTHGFENLPTAVNNVETLASVPAIVRKGAAWYRGLGRNGHAGTKLISLSGDILRPGNYEVPIGLPLRTLLYEWAGGPPASRGIQAVTMAGLSGGFLGADALDVTLDEPSIRSKGSFLGAGGIIVFDDSRDMMAAAHDAMEFFAHESCGKCFPCRIGTQRLTERLNGEAGPRELGAWIEEVRDIGAVMRSTSACGLGMAAPFVTESLLKFFPTAVEKHAVAAKHYSDTSGSAPNEPPHPTH